jgi:hypothetical protein
VHYNAIFEWLVANNLWKAAVAFWVTVILAAAFGALARPWRAWKEHRETQKAIADRLDTRTEGGLADVVKALRDVLDGLDDGDAPDDNGADHGGGDDDHKPQSHGGHLPGGSFPVHIDPVHGGGGGHGR